MQSMFHDWDEDLIDQLLSICFFFDEPPKAAEGLLRSSLGKMSEETSLERQPFTLQKGTLYKPFFEIE